LVRENSQNRITRTVIDFFTDNQNKNIEYNYIVSVISVKLNQSEKRVRKIVKMLINGRYLVLENDMLKSGEQIATEMKQREESERKMEQEKLEYEERLKLEEQNKIELLKLEEQNKIEQNRLYEEQERERNQQNLEIKNKVELEEQKYLDFVTITEPELKRTHGFNVERYPEHEFYNNYWTSEDVLSSFITNHSGYPVAFWVRLLKDMRVSIVCKVNGRERIDKFVNDMKCHYGDTNQY
jgi:hypothetical protein